MYVFELQFCLPVLGNMKLQHNLKIMQCFLEHVAVNDNFTVWLWEIYHPERKMVSRDKYVLVCRNWYTYSLITSTECVIVKQHKLEKAVIYMASTQKTKLLSGWQSARLYYKEAEWEGKRDCYMCHLLHPEEGRQNVDRIAVR